MSQANSPDSASLSDEELLRTYRHTGDGRWLGLLLQRHTVLMLGVAMKYLKDRDAARDAVQQLFLKAITHLPEEDIRNFKGWLYILLRNYCLQLLRDRPHTVPDDGLPDLPTDSEELERIRLQDFTLTQLNDVLPQLNPDQYTCVTEFYLHHKSYQQISEATGFTFGQVKSHIQNGKRNLRLLLLQKLKRYSAG